jgi:hypothetical protein
VWRYLFASGLAVDGCRFLFWELVVLGLFLMQKQKEERLLNCNVGQFGFGDCVAAEAAERHQRGILGLPGPKFVLRREDLELR